MSEATDDPRFVATFDVLRRTGARTIQVRYSDDEEPVVWFVVAGYTLHNGKPSGSGKINTWETAAAMHPVRAAFRLAAQVCDGGRCAHCQRPTGFSEDPGAMPGDRIVCWWQWDPEVKAFVQGCQLEPA
jgi:hypothetical protein